MNPGTGGDLIASDELSTINGGAAPGGLKVQRVKLGIGVDGDLSDISPSNPMPVSSVPLTPDSPGVTSVGTSSALALATNTNRKGLVLINLSTSNISLGLGVAAVLNQGITLTPRGSWTMDSFTYFNGNIYAIAGAAASTLTVQEFS